MSDFGESASRAGPRAGITARDDSPGIGHGLAMVGAGVLRLLLPLRRLGFLAVRSRPVDVVLLVGVGITLTAFTLAIPGA